MMMSGPFWFSRRHLELADGAKLVVALVGHPLAVALLPVHAEALALVVGLRLRPVTELALVSHLEFPPRPDPSPLAAGNFPGWQFNRIKNIFSQTIGPIYSFGVKFKRMPETH